MEFAHMHLRWIMATGLALLLLLQGCAPVAVVGVAAGASAAHDRRTLGAIIDDQNIELKAAANINNDAAINKQVHINVTSMNGIVLLTGEAPTLEARDQVLTQVRAVNGVRRITNEMRITEPSSFGSRSLDSLITSAVKSRMLVSPDFDPTRIKVVTENSVVYLMGLVTHAEGDQAVTLTTGIDGVTGVVKVFEYID
jgi:osmotically-inducible protein OsmY